MGPQHLSCGNLASVHPAGYGLLRFNGAAASQLRKWYNSNGTALAYGTLQWGRSISAAEILLILAFMLRQFLVLQWGRSISAAEITTTTNKRCADVPPSFNGAAASQLRKWTVLGASSPCIIALQWGRSISAAEIRTALAGGGDGIEASMGPQHLSCGNRATRRNHDNEDEASMGPQHLSCGNSNCAVAGDTVMFASMGPQHLSCGN